MRITLLATAALMLSACGQGGPTPTGMTYASDLPQIVTTCGQLFLVGIPTPRQLKTTVLRMPDGVYAITPTCTITSDSGALSSPSPILKPLCMGWCSQPEQVMTCGDRHFIINHHNIVGTETLEIIADDLVPSNVTDCSGI